MSSTGLPSLQTHIDQHNTGALTIHVCKYSGKGMYYITSKALECLDAYPNAKIIVAAGICDCTQRENRYEDFRFVFSNATHIVNLCKDSHRRIIEKNSDARVSYCQLIGMDMLTCKYTSLYEFINRYIT